MIQPLNYSCIGVMAKHCDLNKLCIAENQALQFDLSALFCDYWNDILDYWSEVDNYDTLVTACNGDVECIALIPTVENYETKKSLIYGGNYANCSGKQRNFKGVNEILTYYAYARYVIINGLNDTATGFVTKENEFSLPKSQKELEATADFYRSMGYSLFKDSNAFLCANKETFADFNECKGCGCEKCTGKTSVKGYGIRGNNIKKKI